MTPQTPFRYLVATSEPDQTWYSYTFDDSAWKTDSLSIGFGFDKYRSADGKPWYHSINRNEKTSHVQSNACNRSLYLRYSFYINELNEIKDLNFIADYDDGFIAYLNGVEIARINTEKSVRFPSYDAIATRSHDPEFLIEKSNPVLGIYLDSLILVKCLVRGKNILSVHVIHDKPGDDLLFTPYLINLKLVEFNYQVYHSRYKRLSEIDSTNLPLVIIETDQYGITGDQTIWTKARMGIVNNKDGKMNKLTNPYNEYNGQISIRSRGHSSALFTKKQYRLELVNKDLKDTCVALMGMPKESDWNLMGPYTDKSLIRNKLVYDIAIRMGQYAPRTRFCELVMNGQPEGLYLLGEQLKQDKFRVCITKSTDSIINENDVTGGYIFRYDKSENSSNNKLKTHGLEIVYPNVLLDEQKKYLTRFFTVYDSILTATDDFLDQEKGFRKYASDTSLVDYIIINELTNNPDAYHFSAYMYKDRDDKDGRLKFGPVWDYDLALGNTTISSAQKTSGWQFEKDKTMHISRYFEDLKFVKLFQDRWHELRGKNLSNDSILNLADKLLDQINEARKRNYEIWPVLDKDLFIPGYHVDSYEKEIAYLKYWITKRLEWMDLNVDKIYFPLRRAERTRSN